MISIVYTKLSDINALTLFLRCPATLAAIAERAKKDERL